MSLPPYERRSAVGLGVPLVAIAAALAIGALVNREGGSETSNFARASGPVRPRMPPSIIKSDWGTGEPKRADGTTLSFPRKPAVLQYAAWIRFDLSNQPFDFFQFQRPYAASLTDPKGKAWPFDEVRVANAVFLLIPAGYSSAPNGLVASLKSGPKEVAGMVLGSLPPPRPLKNPGLTVAWSGLSIKALRRLSEPSGNPLIYVDSPLPAGHILTAEVLGTTWSTSEWRTVWALKGPDPGRYGQWIEIPRRYPSTPMTAYVEVSELAPVHVHKRIRFENVKVVERFGLPWIIGSTPPVKFAEGETLQIVGVDAPPNRLNPFRKKDVNAQLVTKGSMRHLKVRLISPTLAKSLALSISVRSEFLDEYSLETSPSNWTGGPLSITLDVDADIYRKVKSARLQVDLANSQVVPDPSAKDLPAIPVYTGPAGPTGTVSVPTS